jgi:hypothetical protein
MESPSASGSVARRIVGRARAGAGAAVAVVSASWRLPLLLFRVLRGRAAMDGVELEGSRARLAGTSREGAAGGGSVKVGGINIACVVR